MSSVSVVRDECKKWDLVPSACRLIFFFQLSVAFYFSLAMFAEPRALSAVMDVMEQKR